MTKYAFLSYKCAEPKGLKMNVIKFIKPDRSTIPYTKGILSGTFTAKFFKLNANETSVDTTEFIIIKKAVFDLQIN